ncbi:type II/IV secretion system ATPase subunit [Methanococcoides methylutens]|uniref:type II/IV secretion system ATPase subunit n=1 Tax=Methanococcoides methylutens TaxID=2226 RepID=UPI001F2656D4|nr:type II/IV secretion system ATPase subunit [Methanococcoides methylutens]
MKLLSYLHNPIRKRKPESENICQYKVRQTKNQRTIEINCSQCSHNSTLNDPVCLEMIFNIILTEPISNRLILSHLYERDYEGKELATLYELAKLGDTLANYNNVRVTCNCSHREHADCLHHRKELVNNIISCSKSEPTASYKLLKKSDIEMMKIPDHQECPGCIANYHSIIREMQDIASELNIDITCESVCDNDIDPDKDDSIGSIGSNDNDRIEYDYDKQIKPHVRPAFSSSRIYTEPPENTQFMECYDVRNNDGRMLQISIYEMTDRPEKLYMAIPLEYNLKHEDLGLIERVRKKLIRFRPDNMNFADPVNSREYIRRIGKQMLEEDSNVHGITLNPLEMRTYSDILAKYTTGLGILEDVLSDPKITDVYVNAPADINPVHVVVDGDECITNIFLSQDDLDSMVSRFRAISGRPFGEATPILEMELPEFGVRVSVIGDPLSANGLAYAFRKHARTPWTLPKLINTGSISPLTAGLLSFLMDGEASILVAGDVGAGKTSLLSAMMMEIPQKYRILTIEDTREIPIEELQQLGWKIQGMNSRSSILNTSIEVSPDVALRAALRLGNSSLVIGEVRGPEVKVLYEAMQVGTAGNSVLGTIHGASTRAVYERIVHTLGVPPASFKSTDAVVVCTNTRVGGGMSKKRRLTQISEVTTAWDEDADPEEIFTEIMRYSAADDSLIPTDILDRGQSQLIEKIARKWGISIDEASLNIRIRARIKQKIAHAGSLDSRLVEADMVSKANNIFWLYMDMEKNSPHGPDYERVYDKWNSWFDNFTSTRIQEE